MAFTKEEFDIMVDELLYRDPISFDMLCHIADKTLKATVSYWCNAEDCLRGRGFEGDIMQDIHLQLMKKTVDYFLLREGVDGAVNKDPEGFEDWMFTVAKNVKKAFANKVRSRDFKTERLDSPELEGVSNDGDQEAQVRIERLKQALSVVLASDVSVYKVLTWLAQMIFMLDSDITKIESNQLIIEAFQDKTLYEMYDMLLSATGQIPWVVVTKKQDEKILAALQKPWDGKNTYGDTKYKAFFMKHNGEVSGKKSISDWVNRMNTIIKRKLGVDLADEEGRS